MQIVGLLWVGQCELGNDGVGWSKGLGRAGSGLAECAGLG